MPTSRKRTAETELRSICLYSPEYPEDTYLKSVAESLERFFPTVEVSVKPPVLGRLRGSRLDSLSEAMARSRMKDPSKEKQSFEPMFGEIDFEKRAASGKAKVGGIVYDGRRLEEIIISQLSSSLPLDNAGIVFTQRLVSTYSRDDLRHHLRTVLCGFPSIVSVPGVVEAPAKPRDYYVLRQELAARGAGELQLEKLKSSFRERFVDYGDTRLNDVLKGLALQAIVHHLTLDPFCDKKDCMLFNAHWQEELIRSQLSGKGFCRKHENLLGRFAKQPVLSW